MEHRDINTCDYDKTIKIIKVKICTLRTAFSKWRFITWNSFGVEFFRFS